jgi:hypothetical protein
MTNKIISAMVGICIIVTFVLFLMLSYIVARMMKEIILSGM